ncbi:com1 regulatory protein [Zalerion maritima]|uniref:Com1 regulatory protein n=1 Tax=Zalerion maritima TaxID=339359 RepID=A0AAD5WVE1_9PEZI|nr:com1 regulatory protein [Zalerion maritima]
MANFQLPDFGILLDCHPKTMDTLPQQAIAMNLNDDIIEDMIKCVQDGQDVELSMGNNPSFCYGSRTQLATPTPEPLLFDLFVTRPEESIRKAAKYPNPTMGILKHKGIKNGPIRVERVPVEKPSRSAAGKTAAPSKAKATNKHLSGTSVASNSAPRSLPPSPLSVAGSPALNPTLSASQQAVSRAKEHRFPIVHELAVREQTEEYLVKKWKGGKDDFRPALEKAADFIPSSNTWALKKNIWKELDVYKYDYESSEDRQTAIDNAIRQYDRIRLSATDLEWQKLLPFEDRGKGKCLSKLQAEIAKASAAPKIKVQKAEGSQESGTSTDELKSEVRSASQASKPKGTNIFNGGGMTTKKKAPTKARTKATTTRAIKASAKEKARPLSAVYITNSDDDGSEDEPLSKARNTTPLSAPAPTQKLARAPSPKQKLPSSLTPKPPSSTAPKRGREEDDSSSSSSGAPLSKRHKQPAKESSSSVIRAPINKATANAASKKPHRASDASSQSRTTSNSATSSAPHPKMATKTTSPTKSSPLASLSPTNASDIEGEGETPPPPPVHKHYAHSRVGSTNSVSAKRRRPDDEEPRVRSKKPRVSVDVVELANRFKDSYQEYESLHFELKDLENPPENKMAHLLDLRTKLESLKKKIYRGVGEGRD